MRYELTSTVAAWHRENSLTDVPAIPLNHLLSALAAADFARWQPLLEPVELPLGKVLYESGDRMTHVIFPNTAIVSLLQDRKSVV